MCVRAKTAANFVGMVHSEINQKLQVRLSNAQIAVFVVILTKAFFWDVIHKVAPSSFL